MTSFLPEIGTGALSFALIIALVQALVPLYGAARGDSRLVGVAVPAAVILMALTTLAFCVLMHAFVVSDFSVRTVAANSHTLKPMLYKIAGTWGNHEGSLLLWVLILSWFGAAVALFGRSISDVARARVLAVQAMIAFGFLSFTLFTSNPFERLNPVPVEGNGLNPLLQDPGLAFHPPFLYLGYVGFSIAFAFAIAGLIEGRVTASWARLVRPWVLSAWVFLTIGIALGSWWAYYELGWGGFWFWDPVENASFMPWLMGTALLHSVIVVERREVLKSWCVLLAILTFSLSLLGTFLVRSGVLTSVHAFATDPERGLFILGFLVLVIGGALSLFAARAHHLVAGGSYEPASREGALILNNWLLASLAATVLLGTLYPLLLDATTGEKISVGPPFFEMTVLPIAALLFLLMGVGPALAWRRNSLRLARLPLLLAGVAGLGVFGVLFVSDAGLFPHAGLGIGVFMAVAVLIDWARRGHVTAPVRSQGMSLAHFGMALVVIGIAGHGAFMIEKQAVMQPGQTTKLGGYTFTLDGVRLLPGPNYVSRQATLSVVSADGKQRVLTPEVRSYQNPPQQTTEAAIVPVRLGDLFVALGDRNGDGGYSLRLYVKPMIGLLWMGAGLLALGGLLALARPVRLPQRMRAKA